MGIDEKKVGHVDKHMFIEANQTNVIAPISSQRFKTNETLTTTRLSLSCKQCARSHSLNLDQTTTKNDAKNMIPSGRDHCMASEQRQTMTSI